MSYTSIRFFGGIPTRGSHDTSFGYQLLRSGQRLFGQAELRADAMRMKASTMTTGRVLRLVSESLWG